MTRRLAATLFVLVIWTAPIAAAEGDADGDGLPDALERIIGTSPETAQQLQRVAKSRDNQYDEEQARKNAPDILTFDACHLGGQQILFAVTFARKPDFTDVTFLIYADMDNDKATGRKDKSPHEGVDLMLVVVRNGELQVSYRNPAYSRKNTRLLGAVHGKTLYMVLEAPLKLEDDSIVIGLHLLSQRKGGRGDSTRHKVVKLSKSSGKATPLKVRKKAHVQFVED